MAESSLIAKISRDEEWVSFHRGSKSYTVEAPADFLDYVDKFVSFKHITIMMLMLDQDRLQEDPTFAETVESHINESCNGLVTKLYAQGYDKSKLPDILKNLIKHYNNLYSLTEFESTDRPKMKFRPVYFDFPFPVRPVLLRYFTMHLWPFIKYLQDLDIPMDDSRSRQIIKTKLAILVNNTVYTDKKIKMPNNIDLTRYDLGQPQKLTSYQMQYGQRFIRLSKSYYFFRRLWLYLCRFAPDAAEFAEDMIYESTFSGWEHHAFRYNINCGDGGKTKDRRMDKAKYRVREAYSRIQDEKISAEQIVKRLLDPFTGIETDEKYNKLSDKPTSSSTILKWVKEWDKENGINRKGFPRAKRSIHK